MKKEKKRRSKKKEKKKTEKEKKKRKKKKKRKEEKVNCDRLCFFMQTRGQALGLPVLFEIGFSCVRGSCSVLPSLSPCIAFESLYLQVEGAKT